MGISLGFSSLPFNGRIIVLPFFHKETGIRIIRPLLIIWIRQDIAHCTYEAGHLRQNSLIFPFGSNWHCGISQCNPKLDFTRFVCEQLSKREQMLRQERTKDNTNEMQEHSEGKCDKLYCWTARVHHCWCHGHWAASGVQHPSLFLVPTPGQHAEIVPRIHLLWYWDRNILPVSNLAGKTHLPFQLKSHRLHAQQRNKSPSICSSWNGKKLYGATDNAPHLLFSPCLRGGLISMFETDNEVQK